MDGRVRMLTLADGFLLLTGTLFRGVHKLFVEMLKRKLIMCLLCLEGTDVGIFFFSRTTCPGLVKKLLPDKF